MKIALILVVLILLTIVLIRTMNFKSKKFTVEDPEEIYFDLQKALSNLSNAIKIKTISNSDYNKTKWEEFEKLHKYLENTYQLMHGKLEKTKINEYSLVYKWKGKENREKPILFTAHMDVVPVAEKSIEEWEHHPFSGKITDQFVWGRGTLDIKIQMIGICEAVEYLLSQDYEPNRDIYIAFGHDEEVGGKEGAIFIAKYFEENAIDFEFVIDEGGCVTEGAMSNVESPVAVIGIGEKGYANIRLNLEQNGGHSSMPPKHTAIGELSKAVVDLENNQCKAELIKPVKEMLAYIGPEMSFINKIIISNLWMFEPLFKRVFSKTKSGNAMLRTTTAATMSEGSLEPNILPQKASMIFNFRILPGQRGKDLLQHIKNTIKNPKIQIESLRLEEPSKISSVDSKAFKIVEKTVYQIFKDAVVSPYIVLAGTDARKYENVSQDIYRFSPYQIHNDDLKRMHGTNERISHKNVKRTIQFFVQIIKNAD